MHRATASAGAVGIDVASEYLTGYMLDNFETGFWSEESVCQQKFRAKKYAGFPTSSLAYATLPTSTPTPLSSPWVHALDRAQQVVSEKRLSPRWRVVPTSLCLTFLDRELY